MPSRSPVTPWTASSPSGRYLESGFLDPDKPIRKYTKKELHDFLHHEPIRVKVNGVNVTYEGLIPKIQKVVPVQGPGRLQPHVRAFVERAVTFTACPECAGTRLNEAARSSQIVGLNIADACAMQISDLAEWIERRHEPSVAPLLATLQQMLDSFVEIGLGYLVARPAVRHPVGRRGPAGQDIRHLGSSLTDVTYVFDEPTDRSAPPRHPADERPAHCDSGTREIRCSSWNTSPRRSRSPTTWSTSAPAPDRRAGRSVSKAPCEELLASGTVTGRHLDDRVALKQTVRSPTGKLEIRGAR